MLLTTHPEGLELIVHGFQILATQICDKILVKQVGKNVMIVKGLIDKKIIHYKQWQDICFD